MKHRTEKPQNQGCFSSYSVNPLHKSRLENFIKRHNVIAGTDKLQTKSKSPIMQKNPHNRVKSVRTLSSSKISEIALKESMLASKEAELKEKEEQLVRLTNSVLASKNKINEKTVNKSRSSTPNYAKDKLLAEKVIEK